MAAPDSASPYILNTKHTGKLGPRAKCLGRELARAYSSRVLAFNQIKGCLKQLKEERFFKGFHFNYKPVGEYSFPSTWVHFQNVMELD